MATPHVPPYTIFTLAAVRRQLAQLQKTHNPNFKNIVTVISSLADVPRPLGSRKLTNRAWLRLRVGDYRILYSVDDIRRTVTINAIGHRREIYR
ncbi:MAG TPA: type II toxin-antitoxin system RelE/ParE family toxin [Pyrinomonadaceae bacterium]|nr:type II toxin-antitoxin system RelE/ParE family toxin [Pyrinomonadaceae bacterium]